MQLLLHLLLLGLQLLLGLRLVHHLLLALQLLLAQLLQAWLHHLLVIFPLQFRILLLLLLVPLQPSTNRIAYSIYNYYTILMI